MKCLYLGLFLLHLETLASAYLDRNLIRKEILLHRLSLSDEILDPFFDEELIIRRSKRQAVPSFVDDEDDISGAGSGDVDLEVPVFPTYAPTTPYPISTEWTWYRTKINFLDSVEYNEDLQDYRTPLFASIAHDIMVAVEEYLKTELEGYLEATPLMFSMSGDDVIVMIDVGKCMTQSPEQIHNALQSMVASGMIGPFRVSEEGFNVRQIGVDQNRRECKAGPTLPSESPIYSTFLPTQSIPDGSSPTSSSTTTITTTVYPQIPSCRLDQATCKNLQCIDRSYICDGVFDCLDGSDEPESCGESDTSRCDPTEFFCVGTGVCAQKIWRCDGDDDCGNGFDEENCPAADPDSRCQATEFECRNLVCIPNSYQCDGETDCDDNSDEEGCTAPVVIVPPDRYVNATAGSTVTLHCEAVGHPNPVISWRVNWGNVPPPPRVTMTSRNGIGTLIIRKVKSSDQGAYTCEAMNANGSILGVPDAILTVDGNSNPTSETPTTKEPLPCPLGDFDTAPPGQPIVCKPCYCSGVTNVCTSSRLEYNEIGIDFTEPGDDEGVTLEMPEKIEGVPETSRPITENQIRVDPPSKELQLIDLSKRFLAAAHYWSLPAQFLGAKINSYGGTLSFSYSYNNSFHLASRPTDYTDVILEGNGDTLFYKTKGSPPTPGKKHTTTVKLEEEEEWTRIDGNPATREDLMRVLSNLDRILLRTVYDKSMISTGIGSITMQVANYVESLPSESNRELAGSVEQCICPEGYIGLSCEECAHGFERVRFGPLIGKCTSSDEQGDSPTAHCEAGYTGPGCTECAAGYVRRENQCRPDTGPNCNSAGTADVGLNGECYCKETTEGKNCNRCRPGYFYLLDGSREGCLSCLCMGVTKTCTSSTWRYSKTRFPSESEPIDVELVDATTRQALEDVVTFSEALGGNNEIVASANMNQLQNGTYLWSLTKEYTGNKLSSYGGYLGFTLSYTTTGSNPNVRERFADVEMSGNGITIFYSADVIPEPNTDLVYNVKMTEENWKTESGGRVSRQEFLILLSNIEKFFVFASQSDQIATCSIKHLYIDEAKPVNDGSEPALAVETCTCPPGYTGLSCEKCANGFYRITGGSYLGTCQPCNCNRHSDECDKNTGTCLNCQHNTMGEHCDVCQPGFYGYPVSGQSCRECSCPPVQGRSDLLTIGTCSLNIDGEAVCDQCPTGYTGNQCERCDTGYIGNPPEFPCWPDEPEVKCNCDPIGSVHSRCDENGQCECKPSTTGKNCDQCRAGFFFMSMESGDGGCLPCFCMGVTNQCSSSSYKRIEITSDFSENFGGFSLTQRNLESSIVDGLEVSNQNQTLSCSRIDLLPRGESYYWELPEEYTGDKIVSYGGKLQYKVSYTTYGYGVLNNDPDVIMTGNDITIMARSTGSPRVLPDTNTKRTVVFNENQWFDSDGREASREHLLMVLADLETILIRATYSTTILRSSISDVAMEIASEGDLMTEPAYEVERCDCPNGYEGLSCEDCAPGFTRLSDGLYLGLCHLCQCNGHADLCDAESGACFNCRDNTIGDHCDECAPGYYGNPTRGTRHDCQPCSCPGSGENNFSSSCRFDDDSNNLVCTACQEGYAGQRCEFCAPGYVGDPTAPGGRCERRALDLLEVDISPANVKVKKGQAVTLRCNVNSPIHVAVEWRKSGSLPSNSIVSDRGRTLQLLDFTPSQAGTYECVVRSRYQVKTDSVEVGLEKERAMLKVRIEEPREMRVRVGSQVSFVCSATSKMPAFVVMWTKRGGGFPRSRVIEHNGILYIRNIQLSDTGIYICIGSNMYSEDRQTARLTVVRGNEIEMPSVEVSPRNQSVSVGDEAVFYCSANGIPAPSVEWTKDDGTSMSDDIHVIGNMLMISSVSMEDQSRYRCRATNSHGFVEATAALEVVARGEPPYVTVENPDVEITEGESKDIKCTSAGIPAPNFSWHKSDEPGNQLPDNVNQSDGVLKISSASMDNQGTYMCTASNYFGHDTGYVRVVVNRKMMDGKPICRTEPKEVTAYVGTNSTITCVVGGDPVPEVIWEMENGFDLNQNIHVEGQKMLIVNVRLENAGKYVCIATNQNGVSRSRMTLIVIEKALPKIKVFPSRYQTVKAGQNTSFTCLTPNQTDADVTWLRSDQKLFTGQTFLTSGRKKLNFHDITVNETGGYLCLASNVVGFKQVQVNIFVLQPPIINVSPARFIDLAEGESLDLRCDVFGVPPPSVVWVNDAIPGNPMLTKYRRRSNSFRIERIRKHHAGKYICRAINQAGRSQQIVELLVHSKVANTPPVVNIEPPFLQATRGSSIQVHCSSSGFPVPTVRWFKEIERLPTGSQQENGTLYISNFTSASAGDYSCLASNFVGVDKKSVHISFIEPAIVEIEPSSHLYLTNGESITACCLVSGGIPRPSVSWTMNSNTSQNVKASNNSLNIVEFNSEYDSGTYTCTAVNVVGSTSLTLEVELLDIPVLKTEVNSTTKMAGQSVTLNCYVISADGQFDVTWEKENEESLKPFERFSTTNGRLHIVNLHVNDSGRYFCVATNRAGSSYAVVYLEVQEIPTTEVQFKPERKFHIVGEPLNIECTATGTPSPVITLSKNGTSLEIERSGYLIEALTLEDTGLYICQARNNAGKSRSQKTLQVFKPPSVNLEYSKIKTRSGDPVTLTCQSDGFPKPNISWKKVNGSISNNSVSSNGELVIEKIKLTDHGYYTCTADNEIAASNKTLLLSADAYIPYFTQTPLSFIVVDIESTSFYTMFNISITFRSNSLDGLLLFSHSTNNDFLSLSLDDGKVEFRFDLGSGPVLIRSVSSIELDRWHTVNISRIHRNARLQLDGNPAVEGKSPGGFRGLELSNNLFIGGIPKATNLPSLLQSLGSDSGFYGCISRLDLGSGSLDIGSSKQVAEKFGIVRCKTCGSQDNSPCLNRATCLETHEVDFGYVCNCSGGFVGKNCQFKENTLCNEGSCNGQGTCQVDLEADLGFICFCDENFQGPHCSVVITSTTALSKTRSSLIGPFPRGHEIITPVNQLSKSDENLAITDRIVLETSSSTLQEKAISFEKNSYISSTSVRLSRRRRTDFAIQLRRDTNADGLILFGGNPLQSKQFLSLTFRRNALELRLIIGSETNVLKAPPGLIGVGNWHSVRIIRRKRQVKLKVDERVVVRGQLSGPHRLNLKKVLFLGGVSDWEHVAEKTNLQSGFDGCIKSLRIDGVKVPLNKFFTKRNTGECLLAAEGRLSRNEETVNSITVRPRYSAQFTGSSYTSFESGVFRHDLEAEQISIQFRSTEPYGLILYHGEDLVSELKKVSRLRPRRRGGRRRRAHNIDFVSIGVKKSHLVYTFNLGGGVGKATSRLPVTDGAWHSVTIVRRGTLALMWIDDVSVPVAIQALPTHSILNIPGRVYLGGTPDNIFATSGRYKFGFDGCIKQVRLTAISNSRSSKLGSSYLNDSSTLPLDFSRSGTLERVNLRSCQDPYKN